MDRAERPMTTTDINAEADAAHFGKPEAGWRARLFRVVFEADTPAGRAFDIVVIVAILLSVAAVMADSMARVSARHGPLLDSVEWLFTALFTIEYIARLSCVRKPLRYATSFFGLVDLAAVLPTYLAFFFPEAQVLIDVRILRLVRVFRVFKLTRYLAEVRLLGSAMANSMRKILVFLSVVVMVVLVVGTLMYVVEGPGNGFTSIPRSIYWALSTITTVGYGDMVPHTEIGRALASIVMLIGWGILAVPTGIVTAEMTVQSLGHARARRCSECRTSSHSADARYCRRCGAKLPPTPRQTISR
jgi:voltage-gated potassium channel